MAYWGWYILMVAVVLSATAIIILLIVSFIRFPLQNTLRAMVGIYLLLGAGSALSPTYSIDTKFTVRLSGIIETESTQVQLSSGDPLTVWIVLALVTIISISCILRLR